MAAPFTAKQSSVMPCLDILKQGRCTLVSLSKFVGSLVGACVQWQGGLDIPKQGRCTLMKLA